MGGGGRGRVLLWGVGWRGGGVSDRKKSLGSPSGLYSDNNVINHTHSSCVALTFPDSVLLLLRCHHQTPERDKLPLLLHAGVKPAPAGLLVVKQPLARAVRRGLARCDLRPHVGCGGQSRQRHRPCRFVRVRPGPGGQHELRDRWVHLLW